VANVHNIFAAKLTPQEIGTARVLMALLVFNIAASFPCSVFTSYITAREHFFFQRVVSMIRTVLNPIVMLPLLLAGFGSVSLVVVTEKVAPCLYQLMGDLQKEIKPDKLHVIDNIAIVAAVGRKMAYKAGTSGKIFATLGENGISIRMITQGPEELNIIVGVDNKDYANTIRVLYDSFVKKGEKR
jgi:aspartate kinase